MIQESEVGKVSPLEQTPTHPSPLSESDSDEAVFIKGESPLGQAPLSLSDDQELERVATTEEKKVEKVNLIRQVKAHSIYPHRFLQIYLTFFILPSGKNNCGNGTIKPNSETK